MAARTGMSNLITRWRRMVKDAGSATWSDDQAQEILDQHRSDFYGERLLSVPQYGGSSMAYLFYQSRYEDLEEYTSGDNTIFRLYDSEGSSPATNAYSVDYINGRVKFGADTEGEAYFLDGRSYDLNGAAAQAWREKAAETSNKYNFSEDGQSFNASQWFEHCMRMAQMYQARARVHQGTTIRA